VSISTTISRLSGYYGRHGLRATARRAAVAVKRALSSTGMVLFYCDPSEVTLHPTNVGSGFTVELRNHCAELSAEELQAITSFWNPRLAHRNMIERFGNGALLWLIKSEGRLAGYGWTIRGGTLEPHFFPLGPSDVHFFDFHVFANYRGRGVNPFLVIHILCSLAAEGRGRAFIEAACWNAAQLSSLKKTPFHRSGCARKWTLFGRTIVCWAGSGTVRQGTGKQREGS
jgi:hypothetical protein